MVWLAVGIVGTLGLVALLVSRRARKLPAKKPIPAAVVTCLESDTLEAETLVDLRLGELREAQEQSLKGRKLDVRAELAKPSPASSDPITPFDTKIDELRKLVKKSGGSK